MGTIYRVTVVEETTDEMGGHVGSETLFELAGRADMVARTAPAALADSLTTVDGSGINGNALAERVMDSAMGATAGDSANIEEAKTRRPRRTKAQIEADRLAEAQRIAAAGPPAVATGAAAGWPPNAPVGTVPAGPVSDAPFNPFGQPAA